MFSFSLTFILISCRPDGPAPASPVNRTEEAEASADPSPAPVSPLSVSPIPPDPPPFSSTISAVGRGQLGRSWREGCPVPPQDLRILSVSFWGFDDSAKTGELVVHAGQARQVSRVMEEIYLRRFPIERMEPVEEFGGDDDLSMEANNTSAFNCREIAGRPGAWSQHAYGTAIDINPIQNPYVATSGEVFPSAGASYRERSRRLKGMIRSGDPVVRAFRSEGWKWGGDWEGARDYQHFSVNGR